MDPILLIAAILLIIAGIVTFIGKINLGRVLSVLSLTILFAFNL